MTVLGSVYGAGAVRGIDVSVSGSTVRGSGFGDEASSFVNIPTVISPGAPCMGVMLAPADRDCVMGSTDSVVVESVTI